MTYQPQSVGSFGGGLNLRDKADAVSDAEAIDAMNVIFTERGAVQQRYGYTHFTSSALTNTVASLEPYYKTDGTRQLLAGCGTRLEALNTSGAVVASATGLTDGTWDFCRFGSPGAEVAYAGNGKNLLRKWDGAAWTSVANSPKARYLAVMAVDQGNRMVAGGFDDSATSGPTASQAYTSRVWFSNAGAPETWGANDYDDFTPGDGENVQAVVAWREFVFIFKETKFFVVNGTDTDSTGSPIFRYYTVDTGVGLASPRAVTLAPTGIYFMGRDGVYFTSGSDPQKVSGMIEPIWTGAISDYYSGGVLDHASITNAAMTFFAGRLCLAFTTASGTNSRVLVYDPTYEWWSLWDIPASSLTPFRIGSQPELVFGYAAGTKDVGRYSSSYTNNDGAAITSYWRSGWFDYGLSIDKTIRESKVWGTGKVHMGLGTDFNVGTGTLDYLNMVDTGLTTWGGSTWGGGRWGANASRKPALRRRATRGTVFSTYFYSNVLNQSWTIARLDHHLRELRVPSVKTGVAA